MEIPASSPAGGDRGGRFLVLLDRARSARPIGDSLAKQVQDAADPAGIESAGRVERLIEPLSGDETVRGPLGDRVLGDLPLEAGAARRPNQQAVDHDPPSPTARNPGLKLVPSSFR